VDPFIIKPRIVVPFPGEFIVIIGPYEFGDWSIIFSPVAAISVSFLVIRIFSVNVPACT